MNNTPLKIYLAGDLFDSKDLGGNLLLAASIENVSGNRYKVMLPQDGECEITNRTSQNIRDADFQLLYECDIIAANFDGTDPDSGTVVEFCFAKMLDMPAVLLRTDFRNSGDATLPDSEPWNLMCSHYPRTTVLHINAMQEYHLCRGRGGSAAECAENFYHAIAVKVVEALDKVAARKSWLRSDQLADQYRMAVKAIGGSLSERLNEAVINELVERKLSNGLYQ